MGPRSANHARTTYTPLSAPIASANLPQRHPLTYLDYINTIYQHNFLSDPSYLYDYRDLAVAPVRGKAQHRRMRLKMRWSRNNILVKHVLVYIEPTDIHLIN
jgi:hypothetical protein